MPGGPIIICDKSTIQSLNANEAFWLGMHYRMNLVPILFAEILADLDKNPPKGRSADDVVRNIATKIPELGTLPNIFHGTLVLGELLGHPVDMRGVPIIGGGRGFTTASGKLGRHFEQPPEAAATQRWAEGDFLGVERDYARVWRAAVGAIDLSAIAAAVRDATQLKLRDLAAVRAAADEILEARRGRRFSMLKTALRILSVPTQFHHAIIQRWKEVGGRELAEFAPYSAHVLRVELFFQLGLATGKISAERPSHRMDLAYLFYLPFCAVFSSNDGFHAEIAPLFLQGNQVFVDGRTLKSDLANLVEHYRGLPEAVREQGAFTYASHPPLVGNFLTSELYDRLEPGWRQHAANPIEITPELAEALRREVKESSDAIESGRIDSSCSQENSDHDMLSFRAHRRRGEWKLF